MNAVAAALPVVVRPYGDSYAQAWDRFIRDAPEGTFFHLSGWQQVLRRAFGHRTHYLAAFRGDALCGVLPLAHIRSALFGNALISTPFCAYGGPVASDRDAIDALIDSACELAGSLGVDYLELRNRSRLCPDWPLKELYVTFRRPLASDAEVNLQQIPRKQRAMVRKGMQRGLQSDVGRDLGPFYEMYATSLRNLGTPVFSRTYLEVLFEVFGEACDVLTVRSDGAPVASVVNFYFRDEVLPYYGGGTARARELAANDFMYYEVMRHAAGRGARTFDYGRSKTGTGSYSFKVNWGFEPQPLFYEYYLVRASEMPNVSPANPKYEAMIRLWRRLPLWMSKLVGPPLARYLG